MFAQCPSGDCQANYCGGCNAEFYTEQGHVVCTPCSTDSDCGIFLHCFEQFGGSGICVPQCTTDDDCNDGFWCGVLEEKEDIDDQVCKPYQQEGEYCGGYTPLSGGTKCMPGLSCTDHSAFIPDLPGRCRKPCQDDKNCGDDQYCSSNQFCRDLGACFVVADCELSANDYIKDDCEGYATCQNGACGWACGASPCTDLSGVEFGTCEMFMGWGVVDGKCTGVSGCGAMGYTFFQSEFECQSECGAFGESWK